MRRGEGEGIPCHSQPLGSLGGKEPGRQASAGLPPPRAPAGQPGGPCPPAACVGTHAHERPRRRGRRRRRRRGEGDGGSWAVWAAGPHGRNEIQVRKGHEAVLRERPGGRPETRRASKSGRPSGPRSSGTCRPGAGRTAGWAGRGRCGAGASWRKGPGERGGEG